MKADLESLKTGGQWLGAASGAGVPALSFFSSFPPPLFPAVSLVTAALSGAIFFIVLARQSKVDREPDTMPPVVKLGGRFLRRAVFLLIAYVLLFQFTTIPTPGDSNERLQVGFGKMNFTLTDIGREWIRTNPSITVVQMVKNEAAFDQDRVTILWNTWSVYLAGLLLMILFFLAFSCWTTGFALLAKHRSITTKSRSETSLPSEETPNTPPTVDAKEGRV